MKVNNLKIYDFEESIVASGLPMMAEHSEQWVVNEIINLRNCEDVTKNPHFKRACKLAANPPGSGHNNFLSGILVSMDVTATNVWWMQLERYHFVQIVSSQSKMHRLRQMMDCNFTEAEAHFNEKTHIEILDRFYELSGMGDDISDEELVYSCPGGLELTARITTNYLALKTVYGQRHNHKLAEWREFCSRIACLPFSKEFIIGKEK